MKITVAIITKDRPDQLRRCINSLTRQTDKAFRVLIIDSSSTQKTKEAVNLFKKKLNIRYVYEKKLGYSNARNRVLIEAQDDILASIDDDCEAFPNWIENIKKAHIEFPNTAAVQGWGESKPKDGAISIVAQFNRESSFRENIVCKKDVFFNFNKQFLIRPNPILFLATKNASFKLNILRKLKLKFNTKTIHAEDFEFSKQLLAKNQTIIFVPNIVVYHWERSTLGLFLQQRMDVARESTRTKLNWTGVLFPRRKPFWWAGRSINFVAYIVINRHVRRSPILVSVFLIEKTAVIIERLKNL